MTDSLAMGGALYDFDLNDFGVQPDYDKEFLNGKILIVIGVSEATFEGDFQQSARSLLHLLPPDWANGMAPFGALLSENSPAIQQAAEMQQKGKVPFVARLRKIPSERHRGQTYWTLEKAPSLQYDSEGRLVDPNAGEQELPFDSADPKTNLTKKAGK